MKIFRKSEYLNISRSEYLIFEFAAIWVQILLKISAKFIKSRSVKLHTFLKRDQKPFFLILDSFEEFKLLGKSTEKYGIDFRLSA